MAKRIAYKLEETGPELQSVIDKVQQLVADGGPGATLFTEEDREKLNRLGFEYGTTEHWDEMLGFIPAAGVVVIYSDYHKFDKDGQSVLVPGLKVGNGEDYLIDLPFVSEDTETLILEHVADTLSHVSEEDRTRWDNKVNIDESEVDSDEHLIINRN